MTKNYIVTIWLMISLLNLKGQGMISSRVFDAATKETIPFVNIGIKNKNKGTTSNSSGVFNIYIPNDQKNDTLTFSMVGYNSLTIPIQDLLSNKKDSIFLKQKALELAPVNVIANGKWKSKKIGLTRNLPGVYGELQSDTTSDIVECGQLLALGDELIKISNFHIYLKSVNTDTASFRINFYKFDGNVSNERVFENEILIRRKISNGWLNINLDEYNVWLKGNVMASIEFLPTEKQKEITSMSYGGILVCKGTSYVRFSSQGNWNKLDFGTYAIYLTTKIYTK